MWYRGASRVEADPFCEPAIDKLYTFIGELSSGMVFGLQWNTLFTNTEFCLEQPFK